MRLLLAAVVFVVILALSATAVKNKETAKADDGDIKVFFAADSFDSHAFVEGIWDSKLIPYFKERAIDALELRQAVKADADAAGARYGYRAVAEGNPFNYAVKGKVKILSPESKSKAGKVTSVLADVAPFDGEADIVLLLGPVFKGAAVNSIRDMLDFVSFGDVKNQVEFSKLARELNSTAVKTAIAPADLGEDGGIGKVFEMYGATTVKGNDANFNVIPVILTPASE